MRISDWSSDVCSSDLTISPSLLAGFDQGAHMIDLLNEAELGIMVLGNHEFDFGPAVTRQRIAEARFPILGANVVDTTGTLMEGTLATWTTEVRPRSEEHTSELQSLMRISYAVFCLKKKINININYYTPPYNIHNLIYT